MAWKCLDVGNGGKLPRKTTEVPGYGGVELGNLGGAETDDECPV